MSHWLAIDVDNADGNCCGLGSGKDCFEVAFSGENTSLSPVDGVQYPALSSVSVSLLPIVRPTKRSQWMR